MIAMALASIPSPSSASLEIGPLELRAYGLLIALGVIAAVWLFGRLLERKGIGTADDASSVGIWGVAAGIVGARLYHVATEWSRFSDDLGAIPQIWKGGLGIPGGLLAGVAAGLWQGRRRGIAPLQLLTCAAPAIPLAQAIGRWGNWFNQELYGRPTDLPWALEIDDAHNLDYATGTTFHPTFLYESLWNLGLVASNSVRAGCSPCTSSATVPGASGSRGCGSTRPRRATSPVCAGTSGWRSPRSSVEPRGWPAPAAAAGRTRRRSTRHPSIRVARPRKRRGRSPSSSA